MGGFKIKFVASYSGGKDSILAIDRVISQGMTPISLMITFNTEKNRSFFHGVPERILNSVSDSLGIPIKIIKTEGERYTENFENALEEFKKQGAQACVFGDIDIEDHKKWCIERCEKVGIKAYFPLWKESRKDIVYEFINKGYKANITVINTNMMNEKYLGKVLTKELVDEIAKEGADICGENGEYHTFVSNGPLFKKEVEFSFLNKVKLDNYALMPIE